MRPGQAGPDEARPEETRSAATLRLLSAVIDELEECLIVVDTGGVVRFWNETASKVTGFGRETQLGRACPPGFYRINEDHKQELEAHAQSQEPVRGHFVTSEVDLHAPGQAASGTERPVLVEMRHKAGHFFPAMLRRSVLRDEFGSRMGMLLRFHPAEEADQLPHGETGEGSGVENSQADLEDRLDESWREYMTAGVPFGLLWITVDQAERMRRTHGRDACEAMMTAVLKTLRHGLKPTEIIGRWGENEFLVLTHERTGEMLKGHAQHLAGLARTTEFIWWGDRLQLTVSIGGRQAASADTLRSLLRAAQKAMQGSLMAGGNHVVVDHSSGGNACSQS